MPKWSILALLPVLALSACQTAAERQAEAYNKCFAYGFKPRTEAHARCLMSLDQQQMAMDFQQRQALAAGLADLGSSIKPVVIDQPKTVHCTHQRTLPGIVETNCR